MSLVWTEVELTDYECAMAAQVGCRRNLEAIFGKYHDNVTNGSTGWNEHVEGAAAEVAWAKMSNKYWDGSVNTFSRGDVGYTQVRSTNLPNGKLIVRPKDSDHDVFILLRGKIPNFKAIGYMYGHEAKQDKFLWNPNNQQPAWFIGEKELRKFSNV